METGVEVGSWLFITRMLCELATLRVRDSKERKAGRRDGMTFFENERTSDESEKGAMRQNGGMEDEEEAKTSF